MASADYTKGDYRAVAERLRPAAAELVSWCSPQPGAVVVDLGAGTGNVAMAAAARGVRTIAVDVVVEQLAAGRAACRGGRIGWAAGDVHELPLPDRVADQVLSAFGLIYADRPTVAVAELARICRTRGWIGMTAWPEDGFQAKAARVLSAATNQAVEGHRHIDIWGTAAKIRSLLQPIAEDIEIRRERLETSFASVAAWWERISTATPIVAARSQLDQPAFERLASELQEVARNHGRSHGTRYVLLDDYLLVRARIR